MTKKTTILIIKMTALIVVLGALNACSGSTPKASSTSARAISTSSLPSLDLSSSSNKDDIESSMALPLSSISAPSSESSSGQDSSKSIPNLLESGGTFERGQLLYSYYYAAQNGRATFDNVADFEIDSTTPNTYDIQFIHRTSLTVGHEYTLCFDAKADAARSIFVDIDTGGPTTYESLTNKGATHTLSNTYQTFTVTFNANATDDTARLVFHLGGNTSANVQLDNIGLYQSKACGEPAMTTSSSTSSAGDIGMADPDFHIYLAFGQSNMEGTADFTAADNLDNPRAQLIQNFTCPNLSRTYGQWYQAAQPYFGCWGKISVADAFVASLITQIPVTTSIGIVPVAIGGSDIGLFRKGAPIGRGNIGTEKIPVSFEGGYDWLLDLAKKAQQRGVIKGIIFHQGETNTSQQDWKNKVKEIFDDLKQDLALGDIPFLAGEMLYQDQGGCCYSHNPEVNKLPTLINNAHVISAQGLAGADNAHFTYDAYKTFGQRYASKMIELLYPTAPPATSLKKSSHIEAYQQSKNQGSHNKSPKSLLKSDGTFSQGQQFFTHIYGEGNGSASFNGEAYFTIHSTSKNVYDIQFIHRVSITSGTEYTLCYDAKANKARTIFVDIDSDEHTYTSLSHQNNTHHLTTDYQTFALTFTATASDDTARVAFHLGGNSSSDVQLDNIYLHEGAICSGGRTVTIEQR